MFPFDDVIMDNCTNKYSGVSSMDASYVGGHRCTYWLHGPQNLCKPTGYGFELWSTRLDAQPLCWTLILRSIALSLYNQITYAFAHGTVIDLPLHDVSRYLYCDDASLEADNVIPTLYAAKKYIIPHLAHACVEYLEANVDASNACLLLSQSRIFEEPELMQRCLGVIDLQAEEALQSDSFTDIDYQTLEQILGRDSLRARETMLFTAATKWAEAECTRQGSDVNSEQCRGVLGDVLYLLRLPTMSQKEFVEGPGESGLLSKQEVIDVFYFFSGKSTPDLRFPTSRRKGYDIETCSRFPGTKNTWSFSVGKSNSIQFSADKSISVAGFGLYGAREATEYRVDVALKENNGFVIGQKRHKMSVDGSNNTTRVLFDNPVQIEANIYYTVSFVVDYDGEGHYGLSGVARVICGNTNFTFKDSDATKNHTSVTKGQIPEILFYDDLTTLW